MGRKDKLHVIPFTSRMENVLREGGYRGPEESGGSGRRSRKDVNFQLAKRSRPLLL